MPRTRLSAAARTGRPEPINPDGERDVSGKPFLDYVLNDLFAAVLATTSALYESTSTLFRNMGFKLRGKAITLAYEKEKAVPVVHDHAWILTWGLALACMGGLYSLLKGRSPKAAEPIEGEEDV